MALKSPVHNRSNKPFRRNCTSAGSEVTEHQEFKEIEELLLVAANREECGDLREARSVALEAIQIDETHTEALKFLVDINVRLQKYEEAFYYAELLTEYHPDNPEGQYKRCTVQYEMKHFRDSIASGLKSLSMKYNKPKKITKYIIKSVQGILNLTDDFSLSLEGMDFYSQLGEVGIVLLSAKLYILVIQLLDVALQLQTNQFGVSMRIYLTQGHALCATLKHDSALKAYTNCLQMAVSCHDLAHQTKALVNIAALHISLSETYKALVVYERLLDMHSRLLSDGEVCEDVWTDDFISGLYMNVSLAYKTVGNYDMALHFAYKYMRRIGDEDYQGLGSIHRHIGSLYDTIGDYSKSMTHYKRYLEMAKCSSDKLDIALAYGHMGTLFGLIGLWPLSIVYHDRHVSGVSSVLHSPSDSSDDLSEVVNADAVAKKAAMQAYEMYGDSLMLRGDFESANVMFTAMTKHCDRSPLNWCRAHYKTGNSHLKMANSQHALHYFEEALNICDDEFVQLANDIKFGIALSLQSSASSGELEKGRKYFQHSIDAYRLQVEECIKHHKFLPDQLVEKLSQSFQGIQMVLAKLGCDAECLEYAEEARMYTNRLTTRGPPFTRLPLRMELKDMVRVVSSQGAPVLYYSFLDNSLLIWILTPEKGLARFYIKKPQVLRGSVEAELQAMMSPWLRKLKDHYNKNLYKCEQRSIQKKKRKEAIKKDDRMFRSLKSGSSWTSAERLKVDEDVKTSVSGDVADSEDTQEQIGRKLYKFLAGAVDDILSKVPRQGHLIVIPDRSICQIPFNRLRDLKGMPLGDKYNITYLSGIYSLKLMVENEIQHLQQDDEISFKRTQSSLGGYYKYLHSPEVLYSNEDNVELSSPSDVKRRNVSNPRLDVVLRSEDHKTTRKPATDKLEEDNSKKLKEQTIQDGGRLVQLPLNNDPFRRSYTFHNGSKSALFSLPRSVTMHSDLNSTEAARSSSAPAPSYHRPVEGCGKALSICKVLRTDNLSTLITNSSTGTDVLTSTTDVPQFSQISNQEMFVVIGNPLITSQMLLGSSPLTNSEAFARKQMMKELRMVSEMMGCDSVFDLQANKQHFLHLASKATVLHIVSYISLCEGFIVMSCGNSRLISGEPVDEQYYLVTVDDIAKMKMKAKLVVISGGWTVKNLDVLPQSLHSLPNAFILAGAESVLLLPHPQTTETMTSFYKHFYTCFQCNSDVCKALNQATAKVTQLHQLPLFPAYLFGNNVKISISAVKAAMLDQNIDDIESKVISACPVPPLNQPEPEKVATLSEQLHKLQTYIGEICSQRAAVTDIVTRLLQLVQNGITIVEKSVLQVAELVVLPSTLMAYPPAIHLLKLLRFNFEPRGQTQKQCEPAVVFPSWDPDGLLRRTAASLKTILATMERGIHSALHDVLPADQSTISNFIDVLALTRHSDDLQLSVSDDSVQKLWTSMNCRDLLKSVGFHQIGTILHFNSTRENQRLLKSVLELFVMLSLSKPESLLQRLDSSALGGGSTKKVEDDELKRLPSILPVLLPGDKLVRRVPWSSRIESSEEMKNKKQLAERYSHVEDLYRREKSKLRQLQLTTAQVQADEVLQRYSLPKHKPSKVKVVSGSSASHNRVSTDYVPPLFSTHLAQRRKYSDFLRKSQVKDMTLRQHHDRRQCIRAYTDIIN